MAGFFCLSGSELETPPTTSNKQQEAGGGSENHYHHHHHQRNQGNNNSLFLFRNEEIYNNNNNNNNNKGFEIWPQYHQNQQQNLNNYYSFGVVPSNRSTSRISINNDNDDVSGESGTRLDFTMMRQGSLGSGGGGGMNCQDCGNQAKKDCAHLRCRTCCKSRGFPCPTHVKSTWVPAARRRERQQQLTALQQQQLQIQEQQQQQQQQQQNQQFRVEHTKRQRDRQASTSLRIPTNTSGLEIGDAFPPELNSPALFRCIKMNSIEESSEQYAYQTAVNIGGHVFKGVLYDQGPDSNYTSTSGGGGGGGEGCSDRVDQHLNLTTATTTTGAGNPSASILDPSSLYPTSFNAFMSGTHFFPSPRS